MARSAFQGSARRHRSPADGTPPPRAFPGQPPPPREDYEMSAPSRSAGYNANAERDHSPGPVRLGGSSSDFSQRGEPSASAALPPGASRSRRLAMHVKLSHQALSHLQDIVEEKEGSHGARSRGAGRSPIVMKLRLEKGEQPRAASFYSIVPFLAEKSLLIESESYSLRGMFEHGLHELDWGVRSDLSNDGSTVGQPHSRLSTPAKSAIKSSAPTPQTSPLAATTSSSTPSQGEPDVAPLRKRIIQYLAKGPAPRSEIVKRTGSQDAAVTEVLEDVARVDPLSARDTHAGRGGRRAASAPIPPLSTGPAIRYCLKADAFLEVDPHWKVYAPRERQQAVANAVKAFQELGLEPDDPVWLNFVDEKADVHRSKADVTNSTSLSSLSRDKGERAVDPSDGDEDDGEPCLSSSAPKKASKAPKSERAKALERIRRAAKGRAPSPAIKAKSKVKDKEKEGSKAPVDAQTGERRSRRTEEKVPAAHTQPAVGQTGLKSKPSAGFNAPAAVATSDNTRPEPKQAAEKRRPRPNVEYSESEPDVPLAQRKLLRSPKASSSDKNKKKRKSEAAAAAGDASASDSSSLTPSEAMATRISKKARSSLASSTLRRGAADAGSSRSASASRPPDSHATATAAARPPPQAQHRPTGAGSTYSKEPWGDVRNVDDFNRLRKRFREKYVEYEKLDRRLKGEQKRLEEDLVLARREEMERVEAAAAEEAWRAAEEQRAREEAEARAEQQRQQQQHRRPPEASQKEEEEEEEEGEIEEEGELRPSPEPEPAPGSSSTAYFAALAESARFVWRPRPRPTPPGVDAAPSSSSAEEERSSSGETDEPPEPLSYEELEKLSGEFVELHGKLGRMKEVLHDFKTRFEGEVVAGGQQGKEEGAGR